MRGKADLYCVVNIGPVGMMIHFLRGERNPVIKAKASEKFLNVNFRYSVLFFSSHMAKSFERAAGPFAKRLNVLILDLVVRQLHHHCTPDTIRIQLINCASRSSPTISPLQQPEKIEVLEFREQIFPSNWLL